MRFLIFGLALMVAACSGDKGQKFSENFERESKVPQQKPVVTDLRQSCSFSGVNYVSDGKSYDEDTVKLIDRLFEKYVTPLQPKTEFDLSGQVDYEAWIFHHDDKKDLCAIIDQIQNTKSDGMTVNEKKAFYINAYNVLTIELILLNLVDLDKGALRDLEKFTNQRSIRNIGDGLGDKVWDTFTWKIGGKTYSLNQIAKKELAPLLDVRYHFAINCASKGCPPLRNEAYKAAEIDRQLNEMSDFFVSSEAYSDYLLFDPFDPAKGPYEIFFSELFTWYADEFVTDSSGLYGSVRKFIYRHLKVIETAGMSEEEIKEEETATLGFPKEALLDENLILIEKLDYDWNLNQKF